MSNLGPQHINLSFGGLLQLPNASQPTESVVQDGNGTNTGLIVGSTSASTKSRVEEQTATLGQTVFTLTTINYIPNCNNIDVFIDGINQVSGTAYTETNSTTITFSAGLHVGAIVRFKV